MLSFASFLKFARKVHGARRATYWNHDWIRARHGLAGIGRRRFGCWKRFGGKRRGFRRGGGAKAVEAQHAKGRLTARERLALLLDKGSDRTELGLWAAYGMYGEWGGAPGAGAVTGLGRVSGKLCMIIANDATVKAGAFFPMTAKKVIRAQTIAMENRIPTLYLVDSSGVFLPLQEDVFPDQDDLGGCFAITR